MIKSCINQACGLKSYFLKFLVCVGLGWGLSPGTGLPQSLTLKEALELGLKESLLASQLEIEQQKLDFKGLQLEADKREHQVSSTILGSRNEVGDSRDLEANAQETRQLVTSYQEVFENGFLWKITNIQRLTTPVGGEEEETLFQKNLLSLNYPLYGADAHRNRLHNQMRQLELDNEWIRWRQENIALQTQIAFVFLACFMSYEQMKSAEKHRALAQQKVQQSQLIQSQLTGLQIRQRELDLKQVDQEFSNKKALFHHNRQQLALLIGNTAFEKLPQLEPLLQFEQSSRQLEKNYLQNSMQRQQLEKRIEIKQKELQLSTLAQQPNVILGGNIGQSRTNDQAGGNRSIYLSLNFPFGGSQSEQIAIEQYALNKLRLELEHHQELLKLQAQADYQQLQYQQDLVAMHLTQKQLAQEQLQLAQERFDVGHSTQNELQSAKLGLIQAGLRVVQAQVDYWNHFFQIMEKTQTSVLSLLK